jgi:hypothetical protein
VATYSSLLALGGHEVWASLQIAGIGPDSGADANSQAYRLCNRDCLGDSAGTLDTDSVIPCLVSVPSSITERADLQTGSTDLSSLAVELRADALLYGGARLDSLWHHPSRALGYVLQADITAAAVAMTIASPDGATWPAVGDALYLGAETVIVTNLVAGVATIIRGCYGSTASAHRAVAGNAAYPGPQHLRGRRVWLRLNFFDPGAAGYVRPIAEEATLWGGYLDEWEMRDRGVIVLSCRPLLGRLDRAIARQQWEGTAHGFEKAAGSRAEIVPIRCTVDVAPEADQQTPGKAPVLSVDVDRPGYYRDFYARLGKQLVQARYWTTTATDVAATEVEILALGCMGTDASELEEGWSSDLTLEIREVLPTSPTPREQYADGSTPLTPWVLDGDTAPTCHPIDLLLAVLTSTGVAGAAGDWDILPARWGLAIPEADLDLAAFRALKEATANLRFPNLIPGWDGTPIRVRQWSTTEICGPLGWYWRITPAGLISIGQISDVYPDDGAASRFGAACPTP